MPRLHPDQTAGFAVGLVRAAIGAAQPGASGVVAVLIREHAFEHQDFFAASVAVGAVLSGLVLANGIAQKRLLCGVSVGVFYALCLSLTTALSGKPLVFDHVNLALLAALLFGGTAGGVLSALGAVGNTAPER